MALLLVAAVQTNAAVILVQSPGTKARIDSAGYGHGGGGGEFFISNSATNSSWFNSSSGSALNGALTFCLEKNEFFSPGGTYLGSVDAGAIRNNATNGYDPITGWDLLSAQAKWVFASYIKADGNRIASGADATVSTYNLNSIAGFTSATGKARADAVQGAIWYLEKELLLSDLSALAKAIVTEAASHSDFVNNAIGALNLYSAKSSYDALSDADKLLVWSWLHDTGTVGNDFRTGGSTIGGRTLTQLLGMKQSQIAYTGTTDLGRLPEIPEPASLLLWSGMGVGLVLAARRRKTK